MKPERFSDWLARYVFAFVLVDWEEWAIFTMSLILFALPIGGYVGGFIDAIMIACALVFAILIHCRCKDYANENGWMSLTVIRKKHFTTLVVPSKYFRKFLC